ncbi:DUF4279 domain-containing protein [Luteibacter flocculans]|uniref:DUF4279 domain-containing protein n=1 Tax=Luteibacter flocculans TaxID=2780091 RepID=A0ABY4T4M2_9GAMM|nr:DUF4279 domain-containing protein [Luteibacter flocculans]
MPDKISSMLGSGPTHSQHMGDELGNSTGRVSIARTGMWRLTASDREPEDLCGQIDEILGKLSSNEHRNSMLVSINRRTAAHQRNDLDQGSMIYRH